MTIARLSPALIAALAALALLLVACDGDSPDTTPTTTATPPPSATPVTEPSVRSTPRPASTPYTVVEPPPSGRVHTIFNFSCVLGTYGPEIHVNYDVTIENTENPAATLTGVKLYIDGWLREDTGPISARAFIRHSKFDGVPLRVHRLRLHIDTWAAPQPADVVQFAECPGIPDMPVAQVVS